LTTGRVVIQFEQNFILSFRTRETCRRGISLARQKQIPLFLCSAPGGYYSGPI
jgi:hypothetical protein